MKIELEVATTRLPLNVRSGPGMGYSIVTKMPKGTKLIATQSSNGWYKHDHGGWSSSQFLKIIKDYGGGGTETKKVEGEPKKEEKPKIPPLTEYEKKMMNAINVNITASSHIDSQRYLFGAPFQFNKDADMRPSDSELGETYLETMVRDFSLLTVTPGKASFMQDFSKGAATKVGEAILGTKVDKDQKDTLNYIMEKQEKGRYYGFEEDYPEYIKYVNGMCRTASVFLGIGNRTFYEGSDKYAKFDWSLNNMKGSSRLFNFLEVNKGVTFAIDGKGSSFSEGMSNSTTNSKIKDMINGASGLTREATFLFGKAIDDSSVINTNKQNYEAAVKKLLGKLTSNQNAIGRFGDRASDYVTTVINGGQIAFPELYENSNYNKSYNIEMKCVSPYGDPESIYLHCFVPMFHWLALSYPRQLGANGYMSPFLVRVFCKGWFNCSMGLVESISIKKGPTWSVDGLPLEIEMSISIKDLYENISLSRGTDMSSFSNMEYMDMISTLCGVNVNKPELARKIELYKIFLQNKVGDIPNIFSEIGNSVSNKVRSGVHQFFGF